jgi:hypothetical protein
MADQPPPWLATMRQITGTHVNDNPVILGWAKKIGELFPDMASYCAQYNHDRIAWCGLTVGYCMAVNGVRPVFGAQDVDKFLYALAWRQFGKAIDGEPQLGDVLIFDFGGGDHHVTLYGADARQLVYLPRRQSEPPGDAVHLCQDPLHRRPPSAGGRGRCTDHDRDACGSVV